MPKSKKVKRVTGDIDLGQEPVDEPAEENHEPVAEVVTEGSQHDSEPAQEYTPVDIVSEVGEHTIDSAAADRIAARLSETVASILSNSIGNITQTLVEKLETSGPMAAPDVEAVAPFEAPFSVPYTRNPNFVGRFSTLSQLFGMWKPGEMGRVGVVGLGGIG